MKQKKKKRKRKIFLPLFLIFFIIIGFYSHQSYETAMHEQLPDSLIEFEQKYPEATDFVENYHKYKNKSFDLDVSHEVRKDNIPLLSSGISDGDTKHMAAISLVSMVVVQLHFLWLSAD